MRQHKLPKIWRRALVVAISKPNKPLGDPKSYRTIPSRSWKDVSYACVEPSIDPLLPRKQARLRGGRSTVYQVTLLTQEIENSFSVKKSLVCRSHSSLRYCMAPRPHLQATPLSSGQAHDLIDYGG